MSEPPRRTAERFTLGALATIALVVGGAAVLFAYTAGWLTPGRLTPEQVVDALSARGGADPVGHRRNHAKGICFIGHFDANGAGAAISRAPVFAQGSYPVIGRFAIGVGDPQAADATGLVRSMAIRVVAPDGEEWRSGMNNMPVFPVRTARAFYELTRATDVDPATGKPDPAAVPRFFGAHPEALPFLKWAQSVAWTGSYADQYYDSLNAFRFVDAGGQRHVVRWRMLPTVAPKVVSPAELAKLPPDFLDQDLKQRMAQGPLRWHLVATLAGPGDPSNDATKIWPDDRAHVDIGTLVVERVQDEANGPCRDFNYDPLILPTGIEPSDDPLLAARSAAYANSFDRRMREAASYPRTAGGS